MIFGLLGKAGAGKDTVADYLVQNYGFQKFAFADPLKQGLLSMFSGFGLTPAHFNDPLLKETLIPAIGRTPRQLMQWLGTEYGREMVDPDLWTKLMYHRIKGVERVVISDVRFPNEYALVSELSGWMLRVVGRETTCKHSHKSEDLLNDFITHHSISNPASRDYLYENIDHLMQNEFAL